MLSSGSESEESDEGRNPESRMDAEFGSPGTGDLVGILLWSNGELCSGESEAADRVGRPCRIAEDVAGAAGIRLRRWAQRLGFPSTRDMFVRLLRKVTEGTGRRGGRVGDRHRAIQPRATEEE